MRVRIKTPSRIHITLIDLNGSIGRIDGGVGLALENPFVEIVAKESDDVEVKGDPINADRFKAVAKKLSEKFNRAIEIDVLSDYKPHVGLGSGTQISLAVAEAYNRLFDLNLSVRKLAEMVGRGGTSGIGVAVFEMGGFVVDGGHSRKEKPEFLPSSASKAKPAPVIARHDFPDWDVILATPNLAGFYGRREVNLFKEFCPIQLEEVRELAHLILMKMLPAVVEQDLDEFGEALWRIQYLGFKKVEIDQYGDLIRNALNYVCDLTNAVGMSSTGPTVFAITDTNSKQIAKTLEEFFESRGFGCDVTVTKARNTGAKITL
jgi:beta-ribofuranosylaminobenzene 5'-phosphate synthase